MIPKGIAIIIEYRFTTTVYGIFWSMIVEIS